MAIGAKESLQNLSGQVRGLGQILLPEQQRNQVGQIFNGNTDPDFLMKALLPLLGTNPYAGQAMQGVMMQKELNAPKVQFAPEGSIPIITTKEGKVSYGEQIPSKAANDTWQPVSIDAQGLPVPKKQGNENGYYTKHIVNGKDTGERKWVSQGAIPQAGAMDMEFDQFRRLPDYQEAIKAVANGSNKLSTLASGRFATPTTKAKIIADVKKLNPDYKEYTYDNDKVFKQQYLPSGRVGQKIANLNTAIEHTGELVDNVDKLGNNDAQIVNTVKNWFAQTFGTARATPLNSFEAIKSALSGELGALFKGGNAAATDPEIDNISKVISSAQNPQALKTALIEYLRVGKQRIDQFAIPYNQRFEENNDFLNPHPRQLLQEFGVIQGQPTQSNLNLDVNDFNQWLKTRNSNQ